MQRVGLLIVASLGMLMVVVACGDVRGRPSMLTTKQVVASLGRVGFAPVTVSHVAPSGDTITFPSGTPKPFTALVAVRMPTVAAATRAYATGYSPSALKVQIAQARRDPTLYAGAVPRGLKLSQLHTARVCNVVLSSYNPGNDTTLSDRWGRALQALRGSCK